MSDAINPDHYKPKKGERRDRRSMDSLEVIDVIEKFELNFHLGNAIKYILRAGKKTENQEQDLDKAQAYLRREKNRLQGRPSWR